MPWLVMAWFAGTLIFWMRLTGGWVVAARMRSMLVRPASKEWQQKLDALKARLRISRPVRLFTSALVQVPTVVGWLRPVVLVPVGALAGLPPEHIEALLAHELAHIRRHDYLVNMLQSIAEALLFYHPAVWWISSHIRNERENCCDDVAVEISGDAFAYARALADLEQHRPAHLNPALAANGGSLPDRIARLLGSACPASASFPGMGAIVCGILILAAALAVSGQPAETRPAFEVASVKIRTGAAGPQTTTMDDEHGAVHYTNVSLKACILTAWGIKAYQLEGMEGRAPERYDIEARPDRPANATDLRTMLQPLLAERFGLRFHNGLKEMPVYKITVGSASRLHAVSKVEGGLEFTGGRNPHLVAQGMSMPRLADFLSGLMDRPVIDSTGKPGLFAFTLDWSVSSDQTGNEDAIFGALERVGLKAQSSKALVQTMIVDHVEKVPTGN